MLAKFKKVQKRKKWTGVGNIFTPEYVDGVSILASWAPSPPSPKPGLVGRTAHVETTRQTHLTANCAANRSLRPIQSSCTQVALLSTPGPNFMPTTLSAFQVVALQHKHSENAAASEFLADYLAFTRLSAAGASADRFAIICCKLVAFLSCAAPTASDAGPSSPNLGSVPLMRCTHVL